MYDFLSLFSYKTAGHGANELAMTLKVRHFPPPGTSKWNKIEHRMFCHITKNWRGRPLVSIANCGSSNNIDSDESDIFRKWLFISSERDQFGQSINCIFNLSRCVVK